ncbi:MAG: hypothetical protein K0U66_10060 [Gammaproteobacteria bacterium]|nr:hypothetical protein [Gammaproteobacteria bacterium]
MSIQAKEFLFYAQGACASIGIDSEVNRRVIVGRAYYSAYLTAEHYVKYSGGPSKKELLRNKIGMYTTIILAAGDDIAKVDFIVDKTRIARKTARTLEKLSEGNHKQVSEFLIVAGYTKLGKSLEDLKRERVKADYKLGAEVNINTAIHCCKMAEYIITTIELLEMQARR